MPRGSAERGVLWRHALKNSLIPLITVAGVQVGYLLGGAVITEEVFTLPGVGRLILWAVFQRDYPRGAGDDPLRQRALHAVEPARRPDLRVRGPAHPLWVTPSAPSSGTGLSCSGRG